MYTLLIYLTFLGLKIASHWNPKLRLFVRGRKNLMSRIEAAVKGYDDIIWFHVASMGEFEDARPVIEETRRRYPHRKILLTFFSPSGYEARKDWKTVDWVFYLPMDTWFNARRFVRAVRPSKAVFTIGEFWFNYLRQLRIRNVDTCIMSVLLSKDSPYMKWYGWPYRRALRKVYRCVMVKNEETRLALEKIGCANVTVTGDPRFDRVMMIAEENWHDKIVEAWSDGRKVAIAGSTSSQDDDLFLSLVRKYPGDKFMIIPHELDEAPIRRILSESGHGAILYTDVEYVFSSGIPDKVREEMIDRMKTAQVLVVNKIGILSRLYRYGWCALVGGGFINLPHSVMEAAVYGMPVAMGPQYHKNDQFVELMKAGAATPVENDNDILEWFRKYHDNAGQLEEARRVTESYCRNNVGASAHICDLIMG